MALSENVNYQLGSISYDQDFDFIELYIKYINNNATEDERKSLELHYISKLYSYKAKLIEFFEGITFDNVGPSVRYKLVGEYVMNGGKYVRGEEHHLLSSILTQIKSNVIPYLSESIDNITKNFSILKVQETFMLISLTFGFYINSIELSKHPENISDEPIQIYYDDKFCYLPNDTGIFGLNTWLHAFFNDVHLVGVPSKYSNFDFSTDEPPSTFQRHDYIHRFNIQKYGKHHSLAQKLHRQILEDPEATMLQKELLILCLWVQVHEVLTTNDIAKFFTTTHFFYADVFIAPDFWEEYNRFRDLVLTQELLDQFHERIGDYEKNVTPKSLPEFRDFIDNQDKDFYTRIEMLARLVLFYYREYCNKYYLQ